MKNTMRPIQGSQLSPNNVTEEVICATKIYDWVISTVDIDASTFPIPDSPSNCDDESNCQECVAEAIARGESLTVDIPSIMNGSSCGIACNHTCQIIRVCDTTATINGVIYPVQQIEKRCQFDLTVIIRNGLTELCRFSLPILHYDTVVLCAPGVTVENEGPVTVSCCVNQASATGSIVPIPNVNTDLYELRYRVRYCQECIAHAPTKLEILGKFAQPRPPILPDQDCQRGGELLPCPTVVNYPDQCPGIYPGPTPIPPPTSCSVPLTDETSANFQAPCGETVRIYEATLTTPPSGRLSISLQNGCSTIDVIINGTTLLSLSIGESETITIPNLQTVDVLCNGGGGICYGTYSVTAHYSIEVPTATV